MKSAMHISTRTQSAASSRQAVVCSSSSRPQQASSMSRRSLLGACGLSLLFPQRSEGKQLKDLVNPQVRLFDEDGDGKMSAQEIQGAYKQVLGLDISPEQVRRDIVPSLDFDGSGRISTDEWMQSMSLEVPVDEEWMSTADENGDGYIGFRELKSMLGDIGGEAGDIIERVAYKQADSSPRDGRLTQEEAQRCMDLISAGMQDSVRSILQQRLGTQ